MSNKGISYLNRNFDDYRESLLQYVKQYYPQIANEFDDASIGSWLIDMVASVCDNLSYYIDKAYSETNIETAQRSSSVYNIARNSGFKVPGPKGSMAEVTFSCVVPSTDGTSNDSSTLGYPSSNCLPIIKKGTKVSSRNQVFEVMEDIDFSENFNYYNVYDRTVIPMSNNQYKITKSKCLVIAGESNIHTQVISSSDIVPFMEITLPYKNVMSIESIIFKESSDNQASPTMSEFMINTDYDESKKIYRYFEVNSLTDQYRWADKGDAPSAVTYEEINESGGVITRVCRGEWKPLTQKFITEYTDKGYLKIIFGSGENEINIDSSVNSFTKYQMTKMLRNTYLGVLPKAGWTMYVLYRTGGGASSNVAKGMINNISYLNMSFNGNVCSSDVSSIKSSLTVTNPNPSISGKDAPTVDELKAMIKYHSAAQERCVTVKDYINRLAMMPPRYGCPYRVSGIEANNKIMLYIMGINSEGKLSTDFAEAMIYNFMDYLAKYRSINDYVEIKPGKIINLQFEVDIFVDKNYNSSDVAYNVINTVKDYMDVEKHEMGEDIFVGDLEKNISNVDGVLNLIDMRIYNVYDSNHSLSKIEQAIISENSSEGRDFIDLDSSNYVLNSNIDSMFEIKNPDSEIIVKMIAR